MSYCPRWPLDPWCLPTDWDPDNLTPEQETALDIASGLLKAATGYMYGPCLVTLRPCAPESGMVCTGPCGCHPVCRVRLPAPVTPGRGIEGVIVDGVPLPRSAWRVDNYEWLVRTDGTCFPACQRLDLPAGEPGTWTVTYWRGWDIPAGGRRAVTALAVKIYADCTDGSGCWIDPRVTQLQRNGVTYDFDTDDDQARIWLGLTPVSSWVASVNPKNLGGPLVFWTPEMGQTFTTTSTGEPLTLEVVPRFIYPGERVIATARGEAGTVLFDWGDGEATS